MTLFFTVMGRKLVALLGGSWQLAFCKKCPYGGLKRVEAPAQHHVEAPLGKSPRFAKLVFVRLTFVFGRDAGVTSTLTPGPTLSRRPALTRLLICPPLYPGSYYQAVYFFVPRPSCCLPATTSPTGMTIYLRRCSAR